MAAPNTPTTEIDKAEQAIQQVNKLADYILREHPDKITDAGAVDVAIELIETYVPKK